MWYVADTAYQTEHIAHVMPDKRYQQSPEIVKVGQRKKQIINVET